MFESVTHSNLSSGVILGRRLQEQQMFHFPRFLQTYTHTHTLKCCSYSCTLLSVSVVGIFLKVCGTSVLPLFIHAPEPLKRAKMLPTHYKTPATHGLALWCHQSGFKGSFSTINQSLVSEDPARENIWTSCAETFEKLRRCCICNSGVSYPEDVCVCLRKREKRKQKERECINDREKERWETVTAYSDPERSQHWILDSA